MPIDNLEINVKEITVNDENVKDRIDVFVAAEEDITRSAAAKLVENGNVTVNDCNVAKNYKLRKNDVITIEYPEIESCEAKPQQMDLDIIYEDNDIVVVNKPSGMVVHPAPGNPDGTLVNGLLYHCKDSLSGIGGVIRPGIVHRIDKDTSGLLVVAKNDEAHLYLSEKLKHHDVSRVYFAIALGNFKDDEGTVNAPIGRNPIDRKKMAIVRDPLKNAKEAVTHYKVLERYNGFTLLRCELETGRTHQIRVHMAYIGHPLLGDEVYGDCNNRFYAEHKKLMDGQCLHAGELKLTHPKTKEEMHFKADMPENMQKLIKILRTMQ